MLPGPVLFWVLVGSAVSGTSGQSIIAELGKNVTLNCIAENISTDLVFEWSRPDLQGKEYAFFHRSDGPFLEYQHESFKDRVSLKNKKMKDGDLSVVLKNVTINDNGTYECRVKIPGRTKRSILNSPPICTIYLLVSPPGDGGGQGEREDRGSRGFLGLIVLPVLVLVVLVLVVVWIYKKKKGSNQISKGSNNQPNPESDLLNSKSQRNTANI